MTRHRGTRPLLSAAVACATALGLSGCLTEADREAAGSVESALSDEAGVSDVVVDQEVTGTDIDNGIGIQMEPDASGDEIAALLGSIEPIAEDAGLDGFLRVRLTREGGDVDPDADVDRIEYDASFDDPDPDQVAGRLVTLAERLDGAGTATVAGSGAVTLQVPGIDLAGVSAAADRVAADDVLGGWPGWTVVSAGDVARLSSLGPLTPDVAAQWAAFAGSFEAAARVKPRLVHLSHAGGDASYLEVILRVRPEVEPADLTPTAYGDRLWPLLRAQLDAVRDLAPGTRLRVSNQSQAEPGGDPEQIDVDPLLEVTLGQGAVPDPLRRGWDVGAEDYLRRG